MSAPLVLLGIKCGSLVNINFDGFSFTKLRQSAERVDVRPDIPEDGGRPDDGSTGNNNDADDGGPAGGNRSVTSCIRHEGLIQ